MSISKEAVEAADKIWRAYPKRYTPTLAKDMLEAALPHLAPQPTQSDEKRAPVQGYSAGIPWSMHLRAYDAYCKKYSPQQALIEGWCRGGFATGELDDFIPGWREELSEFAAKDAQIAALREALGPFAEIANIDIGSTEDDDDLFAPISPENRRGPKPTVGMFRRARAALEKSGGVL